MVSMALCLSVTLLGQVALADPGIGSPAPDVALSDENARPTHLTPTHGRVLIVDFFATWCGPCHAALGALDEIALEHASSVRLVVIAVGESPDDVRRFFAAHPLRAQATVLYDRDGSAARAYGQHRFPTTFLVDGEGVIRRINRGYGGGYPARVRRWLGELFAEAH